MMQPMKIAEQKLITNRHFFALVTLTLTQWPSHTNLTRFPWRYTRWANMNFLQEGFQKLSSDIHIDRQTDNKYLIPARRLCFFIFLKSIFLCRFSWTLPGGSDGFDAELFASFDFLLSLNSTVSKLCQQMPCLLMITEVDSLEKLLSYKHTDSKYDNEKF